jgi:hypothetical protein
MPVLENLTSFAAIDLISADRTGAEHLVVCVSGRFLLPPAGRPREHAPAPADEQPLPPLIDQYWGEPGRSSLRMEGQSTWHRPATDVYVTGHAHPPLGRRASSVAVRVQVGRARRAALVFGDRVWHRSAAGRVAPTGPQPFHSMPLRYEHAFGGVARTPPDGDEAAPAAFEPRNPVGRGFSTSEDEALDQLLPNIEDPDALLVHPEDRPAPIGFGPVARSWMPRRALAGTYDARWIEERAPLWPEDLDERFFCAASPGLVASPWLRGGEPIVLEGLSPEGTIAFPLPSYRLVARCAFRDRSERRPLVLDAVHLDPDEGHFTLIWRAAFRAHRELAEHLRCVVRALEPWEEDR